MKNDDRQSVTPRLRFLEFIGDTVREVQLKDATAESTTHNGEMLPLTPVMGVTKTEGIMPIQSRCAQAGTRRVGSLCGGEA
jgi:hypothetical protein